MTESGSSHLSTHWLTSIAFLVWRSTGGLRACSAYAIPVHQTSIRIRIRIRITYSLYSDQVKAIEGECMVLACLDSLGRSLKLVGVLVDDESTDRVP